MQRLLRPRVRLTFFLLWCGAWLVVGALLLAPLPGAVSRSDLAGHFLLFCGMALGAVTFSHRAGQLALLALVTMAGGTALEFAQGLVPYRTFDLHDVMANALGTTIGFAAALAVLYNLIRPLGAALRRP